MNRFASSPAYLNGLPLTGQTTVYITGDNGTYQTGYDHRYEVLTTGQYSGTTAITVNGKTDTHSNACVKDHQFKLMWSRTVSASVGPASNGLLPWTTNGSGEGIFTYVAAANTAGLAGYTDWRVPNINESQSLADFEAPSGFPNTTAFPSIPTNTWTSTTRPDVTANALKTQYAVGYPSSDVKTITWTVLLVRSL